MDIFWGIFGILFLIAAPVVIALIFSSVFKTRVTYRGGTVAEPDDLKNTAKSIRRKLDSKYAQEEDKKNRIEEEFRKEYDPVNRKFNNLLFEKGQEAILLRTKNYTDDEIETMQNEKYNTKLISLARERRLIKEKYERISGYPMK